METPTANGPEIYYRLNLEGLRDESLPICVAEVKRLLGWTVLLEHLKTINGLGPRWEGCIVREPCNR